MSSTGGRFVAESGDAVEARAIAEAQWGDSDAIHFLYARYADLVVTVVRSVVEDQTVAENVTQDLFATLHITIRRYELRHAGFETWLLQVARNAALDYLRGLRKRPGKVVRVRDVAAERAEAARLRHRSGLEAGPSDRGASPVSSEA